MPILASSAVMDLTTRTVLIEFCDTCAPANRVAYVAYALSYIYVVLAWVGLYLGIKYYGQLQDETRRALAARTMAHQAQLKMLRYQLNPHFLFNTLNAISTLILDRDNATANRMVQGLSAFLRHSLDNDPMQRVTLRQELDALTLYLGIEKIRFAERLRVETDIDEDCWRALLPSLLLQPLVENAIKYAVAQAGRRRAAAHRGQARRRAAGAARERRRPRLRLPRRRPAAGRQGRGPAQHPRAAARAVRRGQRFRRAQPRARHRSDAAPAVRNRQGHRRLSMDRARGDDDDDASAADRGRARRRCAR